MAWPASSGPSRYFRPGGARSASLSPGLVSPMPRPRLHEVGASSCAAARRRAATVRMTCGSAVEGREGLVRTSQMSFQGPTWRVGVTVSHVAPVSRSMNSKETSRTAAAQSAMQSSQASKVRTRRYSLPTCAMRVRIRVLPTFSAPRRATSATAMAPSSPSSVVGSRVGHSGEGGERKLRAHREIFLSARTDKKMR